MSCDEGHELALVTAGDIMTSEVVTVKPETPITEMIKMMEDFHIIRLPVCKDEKLIGVVSRGDIIRNLVEPKFMSNM
jgi:CBS domain-containing protein